MGERYDKTQTVAALINEDVEVINAYSFQLALLTKDCALLTYRSEVVDSKDASFVNLAEEPYLYKSSEMLAAQISPRDASERCSGRRAGTQDGELRQVCSCCTPARTAVRITTITGMTSQTRTTGQNVLKVVSGK